MPGIDRSRVVGKDKDELNDLTCSICHDIFEEPVITQCCRQSFCKICINQWLIDNNTCPIDRKKLTPNQLIPAPRIVTNLLNKLNVKCVNYGENCKSIVKYEELANHMKKCFTCDSCKTLKNVLSDKQKVNDILKNELESRNNEVEQLNMQLEKKNKEQEQSNKRVDELKTLLSVKQKVLDQLRIQRNEVDALNHARCSQKPLTDYESKITKNEKDYLINVCRIALMNENSFFQISKFIHGKIKNNNDLKPYNWLVMVNFKDDPYNSYTVFHKRVHVTFGRITIRFFAHKKN